MQWGSKLKGSSVLENISKGMSSLQKGCVREKLSCHELNKGILVYIQAEGQGPPGKPLSMNIAIKASQRNSFQHGVRIGFLPATRRLFWDISQPSSGSAGFLHEVIFLPSTARPLGLLASCAASRVSVELVTGSHLIFILSWDLFHAWNHSQEKGETNFFSSLLLFLPPFLPSFPSSPPWLGSQVKPADRFLTEEQYSHRSPSTWVSPQPQSLCNDCPLCLESTSFQRQNDWGGGGQKQKKMMLLWKKFVK